MGEQPQVLVEHDGAVARSCEPAGRKNAVVQSMAEELATAFAAVGADPGARRRAAGGRRSVRAST